MNILLVDDDSEFLRSCSERLLQQGWMVSGVRSAEEAQLILRRDEFDIVLLDLMLPPTWRREGVDLLRTIRSSHPTTTVLMMTQRTEGMTELTADAMKLGAHYFLDKSSPFFFEKMIHMIVDAAAAARRRIFLSHGHDELLRFRLKDFLTSRLGLEVMVLLEAPSRGLTIVEKLERASERCCFAVILLTKDDEQLSGSARARQNVIHELGFFQGKYGRERVVLLAERGVELFSNISGIVRIEFEKEHFEASFEALRLEIAPSIAGTSG
jgi:DNA-binding NarL/FixJ family response regulator